MIDSTIPLSQLEALFLDAGNTVLLMNYSIVAELTGAHDLPLEAQVLARSEPKARIALSRFLAGGQSTESLDTLKVYVTSILEHTRLRVSLGLSEQDFAARQDKLVNTLRGPKTWGRIWSDMSPGLPQALQTLKNAGLKLAIVSNADGTVDQKIEAQGLLDLFDAVIDSGAVGVEKPDPRIFALALEKVGARAEKTLHVGDLPCIDAEGAKAAGVHAMVVDPFDDWEGLDCPTCHDIPELARLILAHRDPV